MLNSEHHIRSYALVRLVGELCYEMIVYWQWLHGFVSADSIAFGECTNSTQLDVSYVWLLIIIDPFEQPTTAAEHTQSLDTNVISDYETNFVDVIRWCVSFPEKKNFCSIYSSTIHYAVCVCKWNCYISPNEIRNWISWATERSMIEKTESDRERESGSSRKNIRMNALRIKLKSERLARLHTIAKFHLIYFCISSFAHRIWFIFINRAKPYYYFDFVFPISLRAIRIHK